MTLHWILVEVLNISPNRNFPKLCQNTTTEVKEWGNGGHGVKFAPCQQLFSVRIQVYSGTGPVLVILFRLMTWSLIKPLFSSWYEFLVDFMWWWVVSRIHYYPNTSLGPPHLCSSRIQVKSCRGCGFSVIWRHFHRKDMWVGSFFLLLNTASTISMKKLKMHVYFSTNPAPCPFNLKGCQMQIVRIRKILWWGWKKCMLLTWVKAKIDHFYHLKSFSAGFMWKV